MSFDVIENLEAWFVEKSQPGFGPFTSYQNRGFATDEVAAVRRFQFGGYGEMVKEHRDTGLASTDVAWLIAFVQRHNDGAPYTVYRGLGGIDFGKEGADYEEASLSSWSLYPSKALRIALLHADEPFTILRLRLDKETPNLYVDDLEDEFLCAPMVLRTSTGADGTVNFLSEILKIRVIDCYRKGP